MGVEQLREEVETEAEETSSIYEYRLQYISSGEMVKNKRAKPENVKRGQRTANFG
jgi:hypothetical protein